MGYNPVIAPGEKGSFISEGDTPTFMNLLNNGLRAYEDGSWGGWGGRRRADTAAGGGAAPATGARGPSTPVGPDDSGVGLGIAPAGSTANAPAPAPPDAGAAGGRGPGRGGQNPGGRGAAGGGAQQAPSPTALVNARFFAAAQHDFAARLKWSVTPTFNGANHPPLVRVNGPLELAAAPGETIRLRGTATDPDRDTVTVRWWQYQDAGTYTQSVVIPNDASLDTRLQIPTDAQPGQTIHLILEATDNGTPSLTRYQRVIVTIGSK